MLKKIQLPSWDSGIKSSKPAHMSNAVQNFY